jgi:hypothetical protein
MLITPTDNKHKPTLYTSPTHTSTSTTSTHQITFPHHKPSPLQTNISTPNKPSSSHRSTIDSNYNTPYIKKSKGRNFTSLSPSNTEPSFTPRSLNFDNIPSTSSHLCNSSKHHSIEHDIESKFKGAILLSQIDNNTSNISILKTLIEDTELIKSISSLIITSFIDGYNYNNSTLFYKFIYEDHIVLEIIDTETQPFKYSLQLLTNTINSFIPDDNHHTQFQIEPDFQNKCYYLTIKGKCVVNTLNKELVNFICSFKVNINENKDAYFRNFILKQVIYVDHIKIKIE